MLILKRTPGQITTLILLTLLLTGCEQRGSNSATLVPFTDVSGQQDLTDSTTRLVIRNRVGNVTVVADTKDEVRVEAKVQINSARMVCSIAKSRMFE